jgi:hypothetical protein
MKCNCMKYFISFTLPAVLVVHLLCVDQVRGQTPTVKARLIDHDSGKPVEYAYVFNFSRQINMFTDPAGEFTLEASSGDTLVLSAVGYFYKKMVVNDSLLQASVPVTLSLSPRAYELKEARIVSLGTWEEFRQRFINLNQPKTPTEKLAQNLAESSQKAAKEAYYQAMANGKLDGVTLLTVPILTRDEKERIALGKILDKEKVRNQIFKKFNPDVVRKVTGLTSDDEIIEFMIFCDFSDEYLLDVNEYDLMTQIAKRYETYKRIKHARDSGEYPVLLTPFWDQVLT